MGRNLPRKENLKIQLSEGESGLVDYSLMNNGSCLALHKGLKARLTLKFWCTSYSRKFYYRLMHDEYKDRQFLLIQYNLEKKSLLSSSFEIFFRCHIFKGQCSNKLLSIKNTYLINYLYSLFFIIKDYI